MEQYIYIDKNCYIDELEQQPTYNNLMTILQLIYNKIKNDNNVPDIIKDFYKRISIWMYYDYY